MPAPAPVAMTQARVSEVSPEMAFYGASGGQPANAMMAMETPAPAARAAAPAGMMEYAGKQYSPDQVSQMLQSRNAQLQHLAGLIDAHQVIIDPGDSVPDPANCQATKVVGIVEVGDEQL